MEGREVLESDASAGQLYCRRYRQALRQAACFDSAQSLIASGGLLSALLSLSLGDLAKLTPAKATQKVKLQSHWLLVVLEWALPCRIRVAEPLGSCASHLPSAGACTEHLYKFNFTALWHRTCNDVCIVACIAVGLSSQILQRVGCIVYIAQVVLATWPLQLSAN